MPAGGDLKRMVMLPLTGERNVVIFESDLMGRTNWPFKFGRWKRRVKIKVRMGEKALNVCY